MTSPLVVSDVSETDGCVECLTIGIAFIHQEANVW